MSETKEQIVLPSANEKSPALLLVEEYINNAQDAQLKIRESIQKLEEHLNQRHREQIVVQGQLDLLLALQERLLKLELTK